MRSCFKSALALSRHVAVAVIVAVAFCATATGALAANVNIVRQGRPPTGKIPTNTHYFNHIQEAVNASTAGDYVLIEPGVYDEQVKVTSAQSGIWIRGMNRNTVIIDGEHITPNPETGANGIEVYKANDVYVENLTVANFNRSGINGPGGNEIWWNGGAESKHIGAHGWWGRYLTAYDTGFDGGYGIFTNNEIEGAWEEIYASGFNDSGIYIGACKECQASVTYATMENNALGYSGSNAGGSLTIEDSIFRDNTTGIAPNSENPGDGPPPQNGECNQLNKKEPKHKLPEFTTTEIPRCTIFRNNLITENDNLTVPANTSAAAAPWGAGIELPGDYADLVEENTITKNPSDGVLAFEYPNPYPPEADTIYFQLSGNRISDNTFSENGYLEGPYVNHADDSAYLGDVAMEGGLFGTYTSTNNCLSGNSFADGTYPTDIEGEWGCQNKTTPNAGGGFPFVEYLLYLQAESENRESLVEVKGQPKPSAQPTLPNPCWEVPKNPLCP
jgi:hypothetical protein